MTPLLLPLGTALATSLPLANASGFGPDLVPIAGMVFAFSFVLLKVIERIARGRQKHETIRLALEKGQTLPPDLLNEPAGLPGEQAAKHRNDRRAGMIWLAIGIGAFVFLRLAISGHDGAPSGLHWIGLIPFLIGLALLINWSMEQRSGRGPKG